MVYNDTQIEAIIKTNPNKDLIKDACIMADRLLLLIHGYGMKTAFKQNTYFENADIYGVRTADAVSNKDMFGRLFQRENMVFTAQGGSSYFTGINKDETIELNAKLENVRFDISLRKWIKQFALPAWRCDPMGCVFMEADKDQNPYPTYKSIKSIYDYQPNGRKLEYVCFRLTKDEVFGFGIADELLKDQKKDFITDYYRFCDDEKDNIYKFTENTITLASDFSNQFHTLPAFILSDIISFENTNTFLSPINLVTELAFSYLNDRSVRDLQKKYHGFLKAIEPLLQCGICEGTGILSSTACPECTPLGADKGTGYKLRTKVADVARFPLNMIKEGFDYNKVFGYVNLPIDVWDKQDMSLNDIENLINDVYWGTDSHKQTNGPNVQNKTVDETATKTLANLQPIYARLNMTADWAEKTENMIADFIGKYMFSSYKKASINYGRYYILETPYELMEEYLEMKQKGSTQSSLFFSLKRYIHSAFCTDAAQLAVELKMVNVEPFVHQSVKEVQASNPSKTDYLSKLYFPEWRALQTFDYLLASNEQTLRDSLNKYAMEKEAQDPLEPAEPVVSISQRA